MVSAIILSHTAASVDVESLPRLLEALHSAQVFDIVVVHDGSHRDFAGGLEALPVKPISATTKHELAGISAGITACEQKDLHGVMVVPLAQNRISQGPLVDLLHQFWISHKGIVVSRMEGHQDVHVLADSLFGRIRESAPDETLEAFVARHADQIHMVRLDEQGKMIPQKHAAAGERSDEEDE